MSYMKNGPGWHFRSSSIYRKIDNPINEADIEKFDVEMMPCEDTEFQEMKLAYP